MTTARMVDCDCGQRHWGSRGAAGLLLLNAGRVLLQHRSAEMLSGATWALPGGALDDDETPADAALRETAEEVAGLDLAAVQVRAEHADDHGSWSYTTLIAAYDGPTDVQPRGWESTGLEWVPIDAVPDAWLHPGLRAAWPALLAGSTAACPQPAVDPVAVEQARTLMQALSPSPAIPAADADPDPAEVGLGWRMWRVTEAGGLAASGYSHPPHEWAARGRGATCVPPHGRGQQNRMHPAPAEGCTCGIRVVDELHHLLTCHPGAVNNTAAAVRKTGERYYQNRRFWGVVYVPDVLGMVEHWGANLPSGDRADPPGVRCVQYARVGPRLHLSAHLPRYAWKLALRYRCTVVVGSVLGRPWLDEVAAYEDNTPLPPARGARVVPLAPLGSVQPAGARYGYAGAGGCLRAHLLDAMKGTP